MDFPEPLFESTVNGEKLCLICAKKQATRALWSATSLIVPLCEDCAADWNIYGYLVLRKIKPAILILNIFKYKTRHPFRAPSCLEIYRDIRGFQEWVGKMKKFM